jgi:hypothetical protein
MFKEDLHSVRMDSQEQRRSQATWYFIEQGEADETQKTT